MRELTDHVVSGDQAVQLKINVLDDPGADGASHFYRITGFGAHRNPSCPDIEPVETLAAGHESALSVFFQNGPIKEAGVNGITQEALLTITIDRLRSFQGGQFACRDNAIALTHCEEALMWLQRRTLERIKRGVEGTNQK